MSTIQRITGTNSGLDVDALVKASMKPYTAKVDTETQNKKVLEYQQEQYKQIMSDASSFYDKYFDVLKTGNLMSTATYNSVSFTSSDSDASKVTAKGFAGADVSNYKVSVTQLASKATGLFKFDDLKAKVNVDGSKTGQIYVNMGATTAGSNIYVDIAVTEKQESDGTYREQNTNEVLYKQSNGAFVKKDGSGNLTDKDGSRIYQQSSGNFSYNVDGTSAVPDTSYAKPVYEADMQKTVENLNKQLAQRKIDITAKYSEFSSGIVLESGQMGSSVTFSAMLTNNITSEPVDQATLDVDANKHKGTNLTGTITKDGVTTPKILNEASNTVNVDNVQFSCNGVTKTADSTIPVSTTTETTTEPSNEAAAITTTTKQIIKDGVTTTVTTKVTISGNPTNTKTTEITTSTPQTTVAGTDAPVSLTGQTNVKELKDKIVSFINDYNTLIKSINTKLFETRDKDYMPLTDAQKEKMTESQITTWEKKAQSGLLRKDSDLERVTSAMKSAMSSVVSGSGLYLEKVGINPVKDYTDKNGMFTIDESKLTKALEENAGNVKDLLTRSANTDTNEKGGVLIQLAAALKSEFKKSSSVLSKKAGLVGSSTEFDNTLTNNIYKKKKLISNLNSSLTARENALYKKYSNLETAMQKLNSQQSSLTSMLG